MTCDVDTPAIEAGLAFARRWLERHPGKNYLDAAYQAVVTGSDQGGVPHEVATALNRAWGPFVRRCREELS